LRSEDSLWILLALCVSAPVPTASACSVGPDYRMPSHFELVKEADAILLAEAVDFFPARQDGELRDVVRFKVIRVLKGALCPRFVDVAGFLDFMGRTEEGDLYSVRRGALAGSCIAYDYRLGKNYVLFGTPYETMFAVSGPPFSRVNEEVDGPESPWTQAVSRTPRSRRSAIPRRNMKHSRSSWKPPISMQPQEEFLLPSQSTSSAT